MRKNYFIIAIVFCSSMIYSQPAYFQYENMSLVEQIISDSFIPLDVVIIDDFLLVIDSDEIKVYNIDNSSSPLFLNKYFFTAEKISFPKIEIINNSGVIIGDKRIITFDLSQLPNIDFSNSTDFTVEAQFTGTGFLVEPYSIRNNKVYYAIGTYSAGSTLSVINIDDPTDPIIVGTYESSQRINGIMNGNGDYLYLACLKGIQIMDVSDASNPLLLTIFDEENDYAHGISYNNYIIVNKVYDGSMRVFDVSNSEHPTEKAYFYGGNFINHVKIFDSFLYTSSIEHPSSLLVYNLEDLTSHEWKARFYNGSKGAGAGIAVAQNIVYYCGLPNNDNTQEPNYGLFVLRNNLITSAEGNLQLPKLFSLSQNYPNPFNPSTTIRYSIAKSGIVQLKIYDLLGSEIKVLVDEEQSIGNYTINFDASNLSNGIYYYRLISGNYSETKKMVLIK